MRRALPGYIFAGLFALSQAGASSWTFGRSWDVYLGPAQEGSLYRSAVCSDGSLFLTDAQGRVTHLNSAGQVTAQASNLTEVIGIQRFRNGISTRDRWPGPAAQLIRRTATTTHCIPVSQRRDERLSDLESPDPATAISTGKPLRISDL